MNNGDGSVHVTGLSVGKIVKVEGRMIKSNQRTLAKRRMERVAREKTHADMPSWVQFRLDAGRFSSLVGNRTRITEADVVRWTHEAWVARMEAYGRSVSAVFSHLAAASA